MSSMCHAFVYLTSLRLPLCTLHSLSPFFYFILLSFHFTFYVGRFGAKPPVRFANEESDTFGQQRLCHRL